MSARVTTPAMRSVRSARAFSTSPSAALPPKPMSSKAALYARNKKQATEGDDAAAASGTGNVLSEVTLPPPDLKGLQVMHPESLTKAAVGSVKAFPNPALDAFKVLSIPSSVQREFAFSPKPATVVRNATLELKDLLDKSRKGSSKVSRHVLHGGAGTGKSTLMLQAVSYAQSSGFVVIYLPSSTPLTNSSTPHLYSSARALFDQPLLSASLLNKLSTTNKAAFKELKTTKEWAFGDRKVAKGKSLEELCKAAGGDDKIVTSVFEAVMEELSTQTARPVLLAIDDCQSLFATSKYVDPSYQAVETFSLVVPRMLLEYVSGQRQFAHGSILLAPSSERVHVSPALTDYLSPASPLSSPYDRHAVSSYDIYSSVLSPSPPSSSSPSSSSPTSTESNSQGVNKFPVPARLKQSEAVGIVYLLQQIRGIRESKLDDDHFLERLVGADGNPREFVKQLRKSVAA
ncbi:hypothetical protein JCM10212_002144 [Sporobolomyces blumeae]